MPGKSGSRLSLDLRGAVAVLALGSLFTFFNPMGKTVRPEHQCECADLPRSNAPNEAAQAYRPTPEEIARNLELDRQLELDIQWEAENVLLEEMRREELSDAFDAKKETRDRKAKLKSQLGLSGREMTRIESVLTKLQHRLRKIRRQLTRTYSTFHPNIDDPLDQKPLAQQSSIPGKRANFLEAQALLRAQTKFERILGHRRFKTLGASESEIEYYLLWFY